MLFKTFENCVRAQKQNQKSPAPTQKCRTPTTCGHLQACWRARIIGVRHMQAFCYLALLSDVLCCLTAMCCVALQLCAFLLYIAMSCVALQLCVVLLSGSRGSQKPKLGRENWRTVRFPEKNTRGKQMKKKRKCLQCSSQAHRASEIQKESSGEKIKKNKKKEEKKAITRARTMNMMKNAFMTCPCPQT